AWAAQPALDSAGGGRAAHDEIDEQLTAALAERDLGELVAAMVAAGVPAAPVVGPVGVLELPPLRARGFVEQINGPAVGRHDVLGIPFRFASRAGAWYERPAPTLGQHNHEVLSTVLGLTDESIDALASANVIGNRPLG
ncbi:MAG: hypothetical protein QOE63_93, partial [Acidimicrobiaceae bacterium]